MKSLYQEAISNFQAIDWRQAISEKRKAGSWENLVCERPEFAYSAYRQLGIALLGKAFVEAYACSDIKKYADGAREISRDLTKLPGSTAGTGHMGSTGRDMIHTVSMNWRDSNVWDSGIRELED